MSAQLPNVVLRVHTDHLGTVRAVSQGANVLWRWEGDQFGDILPNEDVDNNGQLFTMPIRHAGQYFDSEVGVFYNYFRDYDPATGRYVQSDPIGLAGGLNTYGYVGGNPVWAVDPKGQLAFLLPFLSGGAALSELGAVVSAAINTAGAIGLGIVMSNPHDVQDYNDNSSEAIERISNKREYERNCDETPPPLPDPCEEAKRKLMQAKMCLASRIAYTNKWHSGNNTRHSPQLYIDLQKRIEKYEREKERKCGCKK